MTSFSVFASFYCSLSPAEQFTLHISMEDSFPTRHAMLTADYLVLMEKPEENENSLHQLIFK